MATGQGSATTMKCDAPFFIVMRCIFVHLQCIAARCIRWAVGEWGVGGGGIEERGTAAVMPDMKACGFTALLAH